MVVIFKRIADNLDVFLAWQTNPIIVAERFISECANILLIHDAIEWAAVYRVIKCPTDPIDLRIALALRMECEPVSIRIATPPRIHRFAFYFPARSVDKIICGL